MRRFLAVACATITALVGLIAVAAPAQANEIACVVVWTEGEYIGEHSSGETCAGGYDAGMMCEVDQVWILETEHVVVIYCAPSP